MEIVRESQGEKIMYGKSILDDVKRVLNLSELEKPGLLMIDIGMYFPYANQDILQFSVGLVDIVDIAVDPHTGIYNKERFCDVVFNNRYPNGDYVTMCKKNGRRISKSGYFINNNFEEINGEKWLIVDFGIAGSGQIHIAIPVKINLNEENPAASIVLRWNMKEPNTPKFSMTLYSSIDGGWERTRYLSYAKEKMDKHDIMLDVDTDLTDYDTYLMVYGDYKQPILVPSCNYDGIRVT